MELLGAGPPESAGPEGGEQGQLREDSLGVVAPEAPPTAAAQLPVPDKTQTRGLWDRK